MSERMAWLLYQMLKAIINTLGKVPGDHQNTFNNAECEFLGAMKDFNSRQVATTQSIAPGTPATEVSDA